MCMLLLLLLLLFLLLLLLLLLLVLLLLLQQQQFFNKWNRGSRRSSAGDIWQISGSPMAAATGSRRCVSGGTLGTISAIKRSFRRWIIISCADTRIRARPSSPFRRQLRGLNFKLGTVQATTNMQYLGLVFAGTKSRYFVKLYRNNHTILLLYVLLYQRDV